MFWIKCVAPLVSNHTENSIPIENSISLPGIQPWRQQITKEQTELWEMLLWGVARKYLGGFRDTRTSWPLVLTLTVGFCKLWKNLSRNLISSQRCCCFNIVLVYFFFSILYKIPSFFPFAHASPNSFMTNPRRILAFPEGSWPLNWGSLRRGSRVGLCLCCLWFDGFNCQSTCWTAVLARQQQPLLISAFHSSKTKKTETFCHSY